MPPLQGQIKSLTNGDQLDFVVGDLKRQSQNFKLSSLELSDIKYLRLWVRGEGIVDRIWNSGGLIPVTDTPNLTITIPLVPRGKQRVVTAQAYDANQQPIPGARVSGFYSSATVGKLIQVYLQLRFEVTGALWDYWLDNGPGQIQQQNLNHIQSLLETSIYGHHPTGGKIYAVHPLRFDTQGLAAQIQNNLGVWPQDLTPWIKPLGSTALTIRTPQNLAFNSPLTVTVNDPASSPVQITAGQDTGTVTGIYPGNWNVTVKLSGLNGGVSTQAILNIATNGSTTLTAGTPGNPLVLPPVITGLSQPSIAAGGSLTLTGDGFHTTPGNNTVLMGGLPATVTAGTATSLTVTVPAGLSGQVSMAVTTGGKTGNSANIGIAPTITALSQPGGIAGDSVTLTGTGFVASLVGNTVTVNGIAAQITAATATSLTLTIPTGATTGPIRVTTSGGSASSVTFAVNTPVITGFNPTSGGPGNTITISGHNFTGSTAVAFNGVAALFSVTNSTTISATVPAGASTGAITVTNPSGTATSATSFTFASPSCTAGACMVTTIAGEGAGYTDGVGTAAKFNQPAMIAIDSAGNLFVTDMNNHRIRKITSAGVVTTFAGSGVPGSADGTGTAAQFKNPVGIAVDNNSNVWVMDKDNHRIRKITSAGIVTTFAGSGAGSADGTGTAAQFNTPYGLAIDNAGNLFVADWNNHKIRKVTSAGVVTTLAGSGGLGLVDGTGTAAQFNQPVGIAIDGASNLFISDLLNHKIRKVTSAGVVTTLASITNVYGIAADLLGNIYTGDLSNLIRKTNSAGVVTTLAGTGIGHWQDGPGSSAGFQAPTGVAIDVNGNLFVADLYNHRIRKVSP